MTQILYNIHRYITQHKTLGFGLTLLLIGLLAFVASRIGFEEDISKLIPLDKETAKVQQVLKNTNFADKIIIHIKKTDSTSVDELTAYAQNLIDTLEHHNQAYIKKIEGKIDDAAVSKTLDFVSAHLPLFLEDKDYQTVQQQLNKDSLHVLMQTHLRTLSSPTGMITKSMLLKDPFGLTFKGLRKLQQLQIDNEFTVKNGFLISKDQQHILLFISPLFPSSDTAANEPFATQLYTDIDQLNTIYTQKVQAESYGAVLVAVANAQQIKKDIQLTLSIALTVLLLILILFYRKLTIPLILFFPTVFGALLAISFLYVLRGQISAISLGIGSLLLGVTLDYSLHILTHLRNKESGWPLYKELTPPILMSSITTALAFLCLLFLKSRALQDLGIFAAVSVLGAAVFALVYIPVLYTPKEVVTSKKNILDKVSHIPFHKKTWAIIIVVLMLVGSLFTYHKVRFQNDLSKLNYQPKHLELAQQHLEGLTKIASKSIYLTAYGNTEEEALTANDAALPQLKILKKDSTIESFSSVAYLLQAKAHQTKKIQQWNAFWDQMQRDTVQQALITAGAPYGFKPTTYQQFYQALKHNYPTLSADSLIALQIFPVEDFIHQGPDMVTVTSVIKTDAAHASKVRATFDDTEHLLPIDRQHVNEVFLGNLKTDFNNLIAYSMVVVVLLLLLFYKSISLTLVTCIPIFLTWLLTIGLMGALGISFTIFNIMISTFIFGLGIDYGIFITNGLLQELKFGTRVLPTHKTSIILSVITTLLGVGVLIFAKHPALYSISLVSVIGILSAMVITFTLQPILFWLFIGSTSKRPVSVRVLIHSLLSSAYYALGCILFSFLSTVIFKILPISKKKKMAWFHKVSSQFLKSVLYSNPFVQKKVINTVRETFEKPGIIIANHTSALDSLTVGMLHPKMIFLVNDWVYNSPVFKMAAQLAEFYPVSGGIEKGIEHLTKKVAQGYSLMAFPEGTRSTSNKIKRFHKGAFFIAEELQLDIIPVLIHGNSEVQPKGSMVIEDGSITVSILPRIAYNDNRFGSTDREKTKKISAYFKKEFDAFRNTIETPTYFHRLVAQEYKYKGRALYQEVKYELKEHAAAYYTTLRQIARNTSIVHYGSTTGALAFLLSLDGIDRNIYSYIDIKEVRAIAANSYLSHKHPNLQFVTTIDALLASEAKVCIIENANTETRLLEKLATFSTVILLHKGLIHAKQHTLKEHFKIQIQEKDLVVFNKNTVL